MPSMTTASLLYIALAAVLMSTGFAFCPLSLLRTTRRRGVADPTHSPLAPTLYLQSGPLYSSATSASSSIPTVKDVEKLKADLIVTCTSKPKPSLTTVQIIVNDLEATAEQAGVGQMSARSGLLSGEWELLYASEDDTRSSPFFWAFRRAFDQAAQIYDITDAIPAPLKEVGPTYQRIELNTSTNTGRFVSRVKVATLSGWATSIMTTRGTIVGVEGLDGIRLRIDTTKPEDSTILSRCFGPLGEVVNENAPAFPSGDALEQIRPGSSEVIMLTTFCDEGLRISRDADQPDDIFVWRRREFSSFDFL